MVGLYVVHVCLLVMFVSPTKTAEPIELQFGSWYRWAKGTRSQHVFLFLIIYRIGFNLYWHRIAYFVLMVPFRIYPLTHPARIGAIFEDCLAHLKALGAFAPIFAAKRLIKYAA